MSTNAPYRFEIYGLLNDIDFHRAKCCAEDLFREDSSLFLEPIIEGMLEFEWKLFLEDKRKKMQGEMWSFEGSCLALINGELIGNAEDFVLFNEDSFNYQDYRPLELYATLTERAYKAHLSKNNHTYIYMDIAISNTPIGRLIIELYTSIVPKTCKNFLHLTTGEQYDAESGGLHKESGAGLKKEDGGSGEETGENMGDKGGEHSPQEHDEVKVDAESVRDTRVCNMSYRGTLFHRIVPNGWIQGGDLYLGKGNYSTSIYGGLFEDENFILKHDRRGVLGMANRGRHTNGSQFYITLQPAAWMDRQFVAFGKIIEGTDVLKQMESVETLNERPKNIVSIVDCGMLEFLF